MIPDLPTPLEAWDARHARHDQVTLGPSDSGRCLRQSGYAMFHVEPTDDRSRALARLGSLIHLGWSALVQADPNPHHAPDVTIHFPNGMEGHADDVDYEARIVNDLKTISDRSWQWWIDNGPRADAWDQAEIYAYGLWLAEDPSSMAIPIPAPWTVAITAINRETGYEMRFERAADPQRGARLLERLMDRQDALDLAESPDELPREGSGPDTGFPCDYCDWVTACWPPDPDGILSPQAALIANDPDEIEARALDYVEASAAAAKHDRAKKEARSYLTGIPPGTYGTATIKWQGGNSLGAEPDPEAMAQRLRDLDLPVPTRTRTSARQIRVGRATVAAPDSVSGGSR